MQHDNVCIVYMCAVCMVLFFSLLFFRVKYVWEMGVSN